MEKKNQSVQDQALKNEAAQTGKASIVYYTDPLCCWSWAFEKQWRQLLEEFNGHLRWRYCMGGLIPDWKNYHDTINSVTRPVQMGPVWMHAAQVTGAPIRYLLWMEDPPASSYPAGIAVKCAAIQSPAAADHYLSLLRAACMLQGKNIARKEVLMQTAEEMLYEQPGLLDLALFEKDFDNGRGMEAFRQDVQQARYHHINRFPTLIIRRQQQQPALLLTGNIPYEVLAHTVRNYLQLHGSPAAPAC